MIEFSLSIDLGKKERIDPSSDEGMTVDRASLARSLVALAAEIQGSIKIDGAITDDAGIEVGSYRFGLLGFQD